VTTTLTPDLLAHVAAVRDGACDDNDLLVLADRLHDAGEYDREELVRVQCRMDEIRRECLCGSCVKRRGGGQHHNGPCGIDRRQDDGVRLRMRERDLLARNPAWLSVKCPECGGSGDSRKVRLSHSFERCPTCGGEGDYLNPFYGWVDDKHFARESRATITRGFLDITLPYMLCWCRECPGCGGWASEEGDYVTCRCGFAQPTVIRPHPVLRAVLASPVGPWVRRVRVEGREPAQSWWWYRDGDGSYRGDRAYLPSPVFNCLPGRWTIVGQNGAHFDTAEAATDTLAHAVPIWARSAK